MNHSRTAILQEGGAGGGGGCAVDSNGMGGYNDADEVVV